MTDQPMTGQQPEPTLADILAAVNQVGHRLTAVEARLTAVEARMESVETRMLSVETRMTKAEGSVAELAVRVQSVETTVTDFGVVLGTALQDLAAIKEHLGIPTPKPV